MPCGIQGLRPLLESSSGERRTFVVLAVAAEGFDGFPMSSPDDRWLVFASNRAGGHQSNRYIARWVP